MTDIQDNSLAELIKKIEILNKRNIKDNIEREITVLDITELSDNEKINRNSRYTICHKCKNMDILKNNAIDVIKLLNKSIN